MLEDLTPNRLTEYLYILSDKFSTFYTNCHVRLHSFLAALPAVFCLSNSQLALLRVTIGLARRRAKRQVQGSILSESRPDFPVLAHLSNQSYLVNLTTS